MKKTRMREILMTGLRIFGYQAAFGFFGFMFVPAVIGASDGIRIPVIGLLLVAAGILMFSDGSFRGERDSAMSETLEKHDKKGDYQPTDLENAKRFDRSKGILSAAIGAAPTFLLGMLVALLTKPYVYTLQDLPGWIATYTQRPEVGEALVYAMGEQPTASFVDYIRVVVRFMLFPYVGLFGTMTDELSLLFDRVSPLLALVMPAISAIGYQFGPRRRAKYVKAIEQAKNTPRKRLKKDRKRGGTPKEKKQLV